MNHAPVVLMALTPAYLSWLPDCAFIVFFFDMASPIHWWSCFLYNSYSLVVFGVQHTELSSTWGYALHTFLLSVLLLNCEKTVDEKETCWQVLLKPEHDLFFSIAKKGRKYCRNGHNFNEPCFKGPCKNKPRRQKKRSQQRSIASFQHSPWFLKCLWTISGKCLFYTSVPRYNKQYLFLLIKGKIKVTNY